MVRELPRECLKALTIQAYRPEFNPTVDPGLQTGMWVPLVSPWFTLAMSSYLSTLICRIKKNKSLGLCVGTSSDFQKIPISK